jgi:hypothetical protein
VNEIIKFRQWVENNEAEMVSSITVYRGARKGNPEVLSGPSFFIRTYGPTAAFKLNIKNPKIVSNEEWHDFDSVTGNPSAVKELSEDGYDSAINVRKTPVGQLYVVVLVDPHNAKLLK